MIIILALFLTTVFANSQEKYIDLLTDEEKQEFLDNVARRIMETAESTGPNKGIIELADEQLKKHNSYVQSVMDQEVAAFKARRNNGGDSSSEDENDDLEEKPFQFRDSDVDELDTTETDNIDLAVTGMNRRSNGQILQDNFTDTSDADKVTEDTLPLQNSTEEEENVNNQETPTLNSEMQIHESNLEESTTKTKDSKSETNNTPTTFKNNSQYESSYLTTPFQEGDNVLTKTTTGYSNLYTITERNYYLANKFVPSSNATESYTQYDIDQSTIVINTTTNKVSDVTTTLNSQVLTTTIHNTAEVNTTTTKYSAITEDSSSKERLQTNIEKTTFTPILTTSNIEEEQSAKTPKKTKLNKSIKQLENDTLVSYVVSKALKNIKHELELKKKGIFIDKEIETNKGNTHLNHYQVYEIPWPINGDNQPFLRSQEPTKDQLYFAPVSKYSPNFAYYNPKNRLGPNVVEANTIETNTRHLREENNDVHDNKEPSEFILQLNNKMRKFIHLFRWTTTTTTTTTTIAPSWDFLMNPFDKMSKKRSTTTRAPKNIQSKGKDKKVPNNGWNIHGVRKETDVFLKLKGFNLPSLMRSKVESKVNIYLKLLKKLILEDSKSLRQYDWLTTTVQIQSALSKILKLIKRTRQSVQLDPDDLQILNYMVFLYNFSLEVKKEKDELGNKLRKTLREKSLIYRKGFYMGTPQPHLDEDDELSHLYKFLIDVQDGLFDLHEAIKHIADVTKFNRQNWYGNLKQLYLSTDEKQLRELLLHISMSRLVDLVEHSCKQGLDNDFIQFVKTNKKDAKMIVEEMIFINDVVHDPTINT